MRGMRMLRLLLSVAPPGFRRRYRDEMLIFYEERLRERAASDESLVRLWSRILADLLATIAIEWVRVFRARPAVPRTVNHRSLSMEERMSVLGQEIIQSARSLRKSVGFSAAAIVTLALGIASTTAIFSIVDSVLLRPLPFPEPDRIVVPESKKVSEANAWSVTYADFMDWRDGHVFGQVAVFQGSSMDIGGGLEPVRVSAAAVSPQFFGALGLKPTQGRLLEPYDFPPDAPRAVVISDRLWHAQFNGREDVVGQRVEVNGIMRPIVGVLPPAARWPLDADLWVPLRFTTESDADLKRRDNFVFEAIARLNAGATLETTGAAMGQLAARVALDEPVIRKDVTTQPTPVLVSLLGNRTPRTLWILLGAVGLLLLIGCVNVANLQLARATARQRELAVRTALGASGFRLVRRTLVESTLLGLSGGALGVLLAEWMVRVLVAAAPADVPRIATATLSWPVLAFALGLSIAVAMLFGLMPAVQASRSDPQLALGDGARTGGSRATARARRGLVVLELALSVVLLAGAGLAIRSIQGLRSARPGIDAPSILTASISAARYQGAARLQFYNTLRDRLAAAPGIRAAGIATASPLNGGGFYLGRVMAMEGKAPTPENEVQVTWTAATPGYFAALGLQVRGRDFTIHDDSAATPVMIVTATFAKRMFGDVDPIGKRAESTRDEKIYREIIGVVPDMKFRGVRDSARALVWVPYAQGYGWSVGQVTVRTAGPPASAIATVRRELHALAPGIALAEVSTMEQTAARSIATDRLVAVLLAAFATLALLLAAVGIFGVLSYTVAQRTRELGVRMALGARRADVLALVIRETTPLVAAGVAIGVGAGLVVTRLMRSMLFGVEANDPVTFVSVAVLLMVVGVVAALLPARRASRIDPMIALRSD
jgi:putative ABC transport system permease protein